MVNKKRKVRSRLRATEDRTGYWGVAVDGHEVIRDPELAVGRLLTDEVIAVDIETTGLNPWRHDIAVVQMFGEQSGALAVLQVRDGELHPAVSRLLGSGRQFIVHNGVGFDLMFIDQAGVNWRNSVWHDTLVGETLLVPTGRRDVSKSLRASVRRRLGKEIDKDIEHGHWADAELSQRQVEYAAQDVLFLPSLYHTQLDKAQGSGETEALQMEMDLVPIVARMTINGLPVLPERLMAYIERQRAEIAGAEGRLRRVLGKATNFRSTQQLQAALARVGIEVTSTAKEVLIPIAQFGGRAGRLAEDLLTWKHGDQRIKMYSGEWLDSHITNNRIHPHFWQCSADTTRFTCSDPNLQQVPKDGRGDIIGGVRGRKIVSVDYSQIEVRIAGYLAGDQRLLKMLEAGDVHAAVASAIFNRPVRSVEPRQRKLAKAMVFLLLFGGGTSGFYDYVKMSGGEIDFDEAREYVQRFFAAFRGIAAMKQRAETLARKDGPVFIRLPNGARRILVGYSKRSTTILNTMVQGTAAVGIKHGLLEADRRGLTKYLGGQVHDELVADVPSKEAREYGAELREAMLVGMSKVLKTTVEAEVKIGDVWLP